MREETEKRWRALCEQTVTERDPAKLVEIYKEILCILDKKAARLFKEWASEEVESKPT
jgi:hypothetical protein